MMYCNKYTIFSIFIVLALIWFAPLTEFSVISGDCVRYLNSFKYNNEIFKRLFTDDPIYSVFRPFADSFIYLLYRVFGTYYWGYYIVSIILQAFGALFIYSISNENFGLSKYKSFVLSLLFLTSIYSYYGVATITGIMEQLCVLLSILFINYLILYLKKKQQFYFILAILCYFFIIFTHERFIVLFGALLISILFDRTSIRRKILNIFISSLPPLLFIFLKKIVFGGMILKGTGQIEMGFDVNQIFLFIFRSISSIFGFNNGEPWLFTGYVYHNYSLGMKLTTIIALCLILFFLIYRIIVFIRGLRIDQDKTKEFIHIVVLVIVAFLLSILSYSVSSRIEMRQLYVPYVYFLLILSWVFIKYEHVFIEKISILCFTMIATVFFVHNVFFQNYIKDLFFVRTLIYTNTVINNIDKSNIGDGSVLFINNQTDLIWGTLVSENNNIFSLYYGIHPKVVIWKDKEDLYSKVLQKGFNSQDYIVYPISYDELKICNYANYTECLTDIK